MLCDADIDACQAFPCQQSDPPATCTDLLGAPNTTAGRTCSAPDGYYYDEASGSVGECDTEYIG